MEVPASPVAGCSFQLGNSLQPFRRLDAIVGDCFPSGSPGSHSAHHHPHITRLESHSRMVGDRLACAAPRRTHDGYRRNASRDTSRSSRGAFQQIYADRRGVAGDAGRSRTGCRRTRAATLRSCSASTARRSRCSTKRGCCRTSNGSLLSGVVPANAPVKEYWSATVYDRVTHVLIRDMPR
jgi:hypothetical protein